MRSILAIFILLGAFSSAYAQRGQEACVGSAEMRDLVAQKRVVAPTVAMKAARSAVPGAEVLRANLCQSGGGLRYLIVTLRPDGKVVQVTVVGETGRVELVE